MSVLAVSVLIACLKRCNAEDARKSFRYASTIGGNRENNYAFILSLIRKPHLYAEQLNAFRSSCFKNANIGNPADIAENTWRLLLLQRFSNSLHIISSPIALPT